MKKIYLNKIVLNIGVGKSGEILKSAQTALNQITNKISCMRNAKKAHRDWGVRSGEPIGAAITIRKKNAEILLKNLLVSKKNILKSRSFDNFGNVSFGILEHIDIPGVKYDPDVGIFGLNVSVSLIRPGFNIRSKHKKIGKKHKITSVEAKQFMSTNFGVELQD